ncbi:hypothetical protein BU26DRAFT_386212, partial [Trematosphaeria pertusa]
LEHLPTGFRSVSSTHSSLSSFLVAQDAFGPLGLNTIHCPSEPLLDFKSINQSIIFIHGLGGGSRKTWSYSSRLEHFWPKEWLSKDIAFQNVRIHAFGYKSTWHDMRGSILNICDIAESLLGAIHNSPTIRKAKDTKIVLIAHSMGGLVAKKVARVNPNYNDLATRIHSMYFLATPHQGSDMAKLLDTLVALSPFHGDKPFVKDLRPTSQAIQAINHDFPKHSQHLLLYSFYETRHTWVGSSQIIVSHHSATLGYDNEKRAPLHKDHRGVCKFQKPSDPDFITLRNSLSRTVVDFSIQEHPVHVEQLSALRDFLGIQDKPEDDMVDFEELCLAGSCSWYTSKESFREWRDDSASFKVIWLHAKPGAGKSVLTSQVIDHLENLNLDCSYYFFSGGDRTKSTASMLLRSIAYQMALLSPVVRQRLLDMRNEGTTFDKDNEKLIWRKVFLLRCRFDQPQYWVIDALDECYNYNSLLPMLIKLESSIALRVLITSRQSPQLKDKLSLLDRYLYEDQISAEDTLPSIRRYVEHGPKSHALRRQSDEARQDVVEKILKKSDGCFLWVDLVLSELDAYGVTTEAVTRILEEVPPGMDDLYSRTLERLSEQDHPDGKRISKAILDWVVCAVRPLTVAELTNALKLDLDVTMFEQGIRSSCGNLVDIDKSKRGSTVQLVHQTARDFLLKADHPPEMTITAADAHRRIARTCLLFLRSSRIRPVRTKGASADNSSRISRTIDQSPFAPYAFTFFSAHVRRSPSDDDSLIDEIYHFLSTNGLSWIEHVAHTGRLDALVQASQDLNGYLQARAKHKPSLDQKSQHIQKWSVDLVRLVAKFGKHLVRCPSAIYGLIPPLAPGDSAIASYRDSRGIYVVGLSNNIWDVRLCGISYHGKAATAIACGDFSFAVGLQNGAVYLYDHQTFQELHIFQHEEAVKVLKYNSSGDLM